MMTKNDLAELLADLVDEIRKPRGLEALNRLADAVPFDIDPTLTARLDRFYEILSDMIEVEGEEVV